MTEPTPARRSRGTRGVSLTAATFRSWRSSQGLAARDQAVNV